MKTVAEREAVREELSRIAEKNRGLLTPDAVLAEAAKRDHHSSHEISIHSGLDNTHAKREYSKYRG